MTASAQALRAGPHGVGRVLVLVSAALLAACDGYPDGWARIDHRIPFVRAGCPNLTGTYRLHPSSGRGRPYQQSILARTIGDRNGRWPWETVTFEGKSADSLTLVLRRSGATMDRYRDSITASGEYYEREYRRMHSPQVRWQGSFARMTDAGFEENLAKLYLWPQRSVTIVRGRDYECAGGWLTADRVVHDPGPDRNNPRPDTVIGVVRIARDRKDFLVFNARFREKQEINIWCGDGCVGIPVGTWTMNEWSHLDPTDPPEVTIERPWAEPFDADVPAPATARFQPIQTPEEIRALIEPLVQSPLEVREVRRAGSSYDVVVRSGGGRDPFVPLLDPIERSGRFPGMQVKGLASLGNGVWELTLRVVPTVQGSSTSPAAIEERLRALMPAGVVLESIRASGAGFHVSLVAPSGAAFVATIRAIAADAGFETPDVSDATRSGDVVRARIWVRERM